MLKRSLLVAGLLASVSAVSLAEDTLTSPEAAIEFRQQQFKVLQKSMKQMNGMLRGRNYNQQDFADQATEFAEAANHALDGFQVAGANTGETKARAGVWENWDDFEKRMINFQVDARKLSAYALDGNREASRKAFAAASKHCKACHQQYRMR